MMRGRLAAPRNLVVDPDGHVSKTILKKLGHRYRQSQFAGLTRLQLDEVGPGAGAAGAAAGESAGGGAGGEVGGDRAGDGSPGGRVRSRVGVAEGVWREVCVCVCACEREVCLGCVRVSLFCV